jgi:signal transduction histidine kinase
MTSPRRLSLRGRMLAMLVGVTTILLMVMGAVSTYLLARRVAAQIEQANAALELRSASLARAASTKPAAVAAWLRSQPDAATAAEVQLTPGLKVVPLTTSPASAHLAQAIAAWLQTPAFAPIASRVQLGELAVARHEMMAAGCQQFPYLGCKPFAASRQLTAVSRWLVAPSGPALLFVAQPAGTGPAEVRGFIIAEVITGAALIALVALGGEWLIGRGLEPLDDMTRTANQISERGDLTARMPDADDQTEVGRLGSSINTMLDRIQHAFSSRLYAEHRVREFAADASHELRTPLTTIRGYAELYRQGALGPDQLPSAMRRIEQEAQRMSTLVAELLELARLDRTSSLDLTETDLAGIVRDAVADAIAVEPDRQVRAEAPPRLVAVVDEPRIRQVLANLLGNVRAHTPVTTPVAVRLGAITGGVLIEVADAGPGMAAEDALRAFDRFHRAAQRPPTDDETAVASQNGQLRTVTEEPSPPDATGRTGGSGLGLSIVQAIANAHGGRATLESRPGQGTKVRVWLPVRTVI